MSNPEEIARRLKRVKHYKRLSLKELRLMTESKVKSKDTDLDIESLFTSPDEVKEAKRLLKKYLADYSIETISDKNSLLQLIYLEVFHSMRLQKSANEEFRTNKAVPIELMNAMHDNLNQIIDMKTKLGLARKNDKEQSDAYRALELLKKKFKAWRDENQASRMLICPHCAKTVMLKISTKEWEAQKHPFFRDRILGNNHIIELYKSQKLTKEDLTKIFEVSNDYVDWLVEKWNS